MRPRVAKLSTPQSWARSKACFGENPLATDADQCFTRLTSLSSIRFQSRLTGGDLGVFKLLREFTSRPEVHLIRRLALEA